MPVVTAQPFDFLSVIAGPILGDALAPYALFYSSNRYIGTLTLDVTIEETHSDRLEATQYPIATGATVTDHSFMLPAQLRIHGGCSDSTGGFAGYSKTVYDALQALQKTRQPVEISTGKRLYSNMLLRDVQVTTDTTSEFALMVTIEAQELRFSSVATTSTMDNSNMANPASTGTTTDGGTVTPQPVSGDVPLPPERPSSLFDSTGVGGRTI